MIMYLAGAVICFAIIVCIRTFFAPPLEDNPIPHYLRESDLYREGSRLMYRYHGNLYEAIAIHGNQIYVYDKANDKIVKVPYYEWE